MEIEDITFVRTYVMIGRWAYFTRIFASGTLFVNMGARINSIMRQKRAIRSVETTRCNLSLDFMIENNYVLFVQ